MHGQMLTKSKLLLLLLLTISHLTQNIPRVSVSRVYSDSSPDFSSLCLVRASARDKSVERNNGSGDVGSLKHSEWISSRSQVSNRVREVFKLS